ncbi:MAG TPA: hypothetical protein VGQ04_01780 [Chitinophagaceae bacterium]|nr:hypothetical protein [Chitinophagaceae bacterium]
MTLLITLSLCGQDFIGTYTSVDSARYIDLNIFAKNKFSISDFRGNNSSYWQTYDGSWLIINDTISLTLKFFSRDNPVDEMVFQDTTSENIFFNFKYDDGEPIENVQVYCAYGSRKECEESKQYKSDDKGNVSIPKMNLVHNTRAIENKYSLLYKINSPYINFESIGGYTTKENKFIITVKKKVEERHFTNVGRFILKGQKLISIENNQENIFAQFGDFIRR